MGIILFFYGALIKPAFKLVFWVVVAYPLAIISSTLWSRWLSIPQLALIQPRMFGLAGCFQMGIAQISYCASTCSSVTSSLVRGVLESSTGISEYRLQAIGFFLCGNTIERRVGNTFGCRVENNTRVEEHIHSITQLLYLLSCTSIFVKTTFPSTSARYSMGIFLFVFNVLFKPIVKVTLVTMIGFPVAIVWSVL